MKPRPLRFLPKALVACAAPLVICPSALAKVVITNESKGTNVWTLPSGTNLLTGTVPASPPPVTHEGSSNIWGTLTDGSVGPADPNTATSVTPNNGNEVIFPLDLTSKPDGYDVTSFDSYCAWGDSGRDNQNYTLQYSTVANPTTFITIAAVNNRTTVDKSTHTRITNDNGYLAMGVHSIKIIFGNNQENGFTGFREFVLQDTPVIPCVMTEANDNNAFFIPGGTNLLAGIVPPETPATNEGSSASWATVTDGSLGNHNDTSASVAPNNGQTVTYPLDLTDHPEGRTIHSFDSFCAWGSNGRDDQNYILSYSTVEDEETFIPIATVVAHTEHNGINSNRRATHARVTANGGPLATGVHSIRLTFQNQENGYTGFREFFLSDQPVNQTTYAANQTNSWTLPPGANLLAAATNIDPAVPAGANHGNGDITSSNWSTLTDGSVGSAGTQLHSVAPLNNTSVTYTLDTSVNTMGYNLSSFDSYAAWGDTGRDNQDFTILYSTVSDPGTFIPIETIANHTNLPVNATHTRILPDSGFLATNVGAIRFYFNNQENNYVGYREFIALGSAVPLFSPLTWSGLDGTGGNADWIDAPDDNWTDGMGSSPFNSLAPLTFDDTGINTNISIPTTLTADSLVFTNGSTPYTFGGDGLTVSNGISLQGTGNATFNNQIATGGVSVSGSGNLTLATDNSLNGSSTVSNGVLTLASDFALGTSSLTLMGGEARFVSAGPSVDSISGTAGSIILGNPSGGGSPSELFVGDGTSTTFAGSITDASGSAIGSLNKYGTGTLLLTGTNTYTGTTTVSDGVLALGKRLSLYNGNTALWTASNLLVNTDLTLRMGGTGEFTGSDVAALDTGGFLPGAVLGLDTTGGNAEVSASFGGDISIEKKGLNSLTLSGANSHTGTVTVAQGALFSSSELGTPISGDLMVGNVTFDAFAIMLHDNQFGPDSLLRFNTGAGAVNGKFQLRGTNQTVAGLDSPAYNQRAIIQNDETASPGFISNPAPCILTIDVPENHFHSFRGIIRNQNGGAVSLVKRGLGTQELTSVTIQGYGYSGTTTIEEGSLRINLSTGSTGFASDFYIDTPGNLNLHSSMGNYNFDRYITGGGNVLVSGTSAVILRNAANSWTGGLTVDGGFLAISVTNGGALGNGDGPGQTCPVGAMDPSNVITITNGGTLSLDNAAPLGNSPMLPEHAPTVIVHEGSRIYGGTNSVAFVPNLTLDGGAVEVRDGANTGGFGTNLAFVGTVTVGGSSTQPALIHTTGAGDNANISLGSNGLPGTTFQVADVTSSPDADLTISSIIRNIGANPSSLVKTGPGAMSLEGENTYTGLTTVSGGLLTVNGNAIPDSNAVNIDGGKLDISSDETVGTLFLGGVQQIAGTYGSTASSATYQDDARFSGTGILTVTTGPVTDPYELWSSLIPDENERDRSDDPDGDGFTNLEEFLFGTSPIANNGSLTETERTEAGLIVRWNQRADTGTYVLRESATMAENPWPASTATVGDNPVQDLPDYVRKQALIPVDSTRKFVRVEATE